MMSKCKRKRKTVNNRLRRTPFVKKTSRQRQRERRTVPSENTIEQTNSESIFVSEPTPLFSTPTQSVDAPGDVGSKMTLWYSDNDAEKDQETKKKTWCDENATCAKSSSDAEAYKNNDPWIGKLHALIVIA